MFLDVSTLFQHPPHPTSWASHCCTAAPPKEKLKIINYYYRVTSTKMRWMILEESYEEMNFLRQIHTWRPFMLRNSIENFLWHRSAARYFRASKANRDERFVSLMLMKFKIKPSAFFSKTWLRNCKEKEIN